MICHQADKEPIGPGLPEDPPHSKEWSYASAIGCLNYLGNHTRPDIQYAVHAAGRYTHHPKERHSIAIKRIGRYLLGTRSKGMIFRPLDNVTLDLYVDADFAGMWNASTHEQDPLRVKLRTGFLLMLAGCPLLWASKLQSEIATSTLESEFIALSQAMRELIPARSILQTIGPLVGFSVPEGANLKSTVFEDNNGCLTLATIPKLTPRTKHIGVKNFWFKSKVLPAEETGISIVKVASENQLADMFTKGLVNDLFIPLRHALQGWRFDHGGSADNAVVNNNIGFIREGVSQFYARWFNPHA